MFGNDPPYAENETTLSVLKYLLRNKNKLSDKVFETPYSLPTISINMQLLAFFFFDKDPWVEGCYASLYGLKALSKNLRCCIGWLSVPCYIITIFEDGEFLVPPVSTPRRIPTNVHFEQGLVCIKV